MPLFTDNKGRTKKNIGDLANLEIPEGWYSPLEYILAVVNDPTEKDTDRRDRLAIAALPYVHHRTYQYKSKKEQDAEKAGRGNSGWDSLLDDENAEEAPPPIN